MNEHWRAADAEAHAAKAAAIGVAMDSLIGCQAALEPLERLLVDGLLVILEHARDRHEDAAKLAAA